MTTLVGWALGSAFCWIMCGFAVTAAALWLRPEAPRWDGLDFESLSVRVLHVFGLAACWPILVPLLASRPRGRHR